jgi:threonine dehydrogenase-like Zn-dependent dehydrogenase
MKAVVKSSPGPGIQIRDVVAARKLNLAPLISRILPLERAGEGFEALSRREALKILLKPKA